MKYYKIMSGFRSVYADRCYKEGFVGTEYGIREDMSTSPADDYWKFSEYFIPIYLRENPDKNKISAGLACGAFWAISHDMQIGDIVITPNGHGRFLIGSINSNYSYHPDDILPHRRQVQWFANDIVRISLSEELRAATKSSGTLLDISQYRPELQSIIKSWENATANSAEEDVSSMPFVLEKTLENFLVENWASTDLGRTYNIYTEDGEVVGQQYPSDTGPIDILAISKDNKTLLVIELKKGKASDAVLGQIQRYMGFVKSQLAEPNQEVKGAIIALSDDLRIQRALSVTQGIEFYTYQMTFKLVKK